MISTFKNMLAWEKRLAANLAPVHLPPAADCCSVELSMEYDGRGFRRSLRGRRTKGREGGSWMRARSATRARSAIVGRSDRASRSRRASRLHSTSPLPTLCTPATQATLDAEGIGTIYGRGTCEVYTDDGWQSGWHHTQKAHCIRFRDRRSEVNFLRKLSRRKQRFISTANAELKLCLAFQIIQRSCRRVQTMLEESTFVVLTTTIISSVLIWVSIWDAEISTKGKISKFSL